MVFLGRGSSDGSALARTAWALWMNPVHGLAMTYWQGLVRQKQIPSEHNGAVLACTYLAAAVATAVAGGCVALRRSPASLVIASMVGAGALLLKVVAESRVLPVYALLVLYQCLFEARTASQERILALMSPWCRIWHGAHQPPNHSRRKYSRGVQLLFFAGWPAGRMFPSGLTREFIAQRGFVPRCSALDHLAAWFDEI